MSKAEFQRKITFYIQTIHLLVKGFLGEEWQHVSGNYRVNIEYTILIRYLTSLYQEYDISFESKWPIIDQHVFNFLKKNFNFNFFSILTPFWREKAPSPIFYNNLKAEYFDLYFTIAENADSKIAEKLKNESLILRKKRCIENSEIKQDKKKPRFETNSGEEDYYLPDETLLGNYESDTTRGVTEGENDFENFNESEDVDQATQELARSEEKKEEKHFIKFFLKYLFEFLKLPAFLTDNFKALWLSTILELGLKNQISSLYFKFEIIKTFLKESFLDVEAIEIRSNEEKISHKKNNVFEFVPVKNTSDLTSIFLPRTKEILLNTENEFFKYPDENQFILLGANY